MVITDDVKEELSLRFRAVYELDEKLDAYKSETKVCNASKRETMKALADKLEVPQKVLKLAYKQYVNSIEEPEETKEVDGVIAIIKEYNLLKK
jgi:hypothetical protein